jgi:DNA-binding MltR family transcriptional regulator
MKWFKRRYNALIKIWAKLNNDSQNMYFRDYVIVHEVNCLPF